MNNAMILCATCNEKLWAVRVMADGNPTTIPATPQVPVFGEGKECCPFCGQHPFYSNSPDRVRVLIKDEVENRVKVA